MIALRECDVGAIEKIEVEAHPNDPGFVHVTRFFRENTIMEEDIGRFTSSQL